MSWGSDKLRKVGGPCGICSVGSMLLVATEFTTGAELGAALAWYLLFAGIGYTGRIPIHVFGTKYVVRHPSRHANPKLRRRLNFLTCLNAVSAAVWLTAGWYLLTQPAPPLPLEGGFALVFYILVMWLGMETVGCATDLGLPRGTEYVCKSSVGQRFINLRERAPEETLIQEGMDLVARKTPPHQASWFLALVAAAVLALPSGAYSAMLAEKTLNKAPVAEVAQGRALGAAQPSRKHSAVDPSYEDECGRKAVPGDPAPSPQREQLRALWLGGSGIAGFGAGEGGCAKAATPVKEHPDVWIAQGYCGPSFRSLGIAAPGYLPSLLFQQAGEFALGKARAGELHGASSRWRVGDGDGYVIDTDSGSYVLARADAAGAETEPEGNLPCERFEETNVPYVVVPPGLISLWLEVNEDGWVWPTLAADDPDRYVFRDEGGSEVATAHCYSDTRCAAWIGGVLHPTTGSLFTSVSVLLGDTG